MSQDSTNVSADTTSDTISSPSNRNVVEISLRLLHQVRHNVANPNQRFNIRGFPESHPGHLTLEQRVRLSSILRNSTIAHHYRYGSSLGTIYTAGTYTCPQSTPEMVYVVLNAELISN